MQNVNEVIEKVIAAESIIKSALKFRDVLPSEYNTYIANLCADDILEFADGSPDAIHDDFLAFCFSKGRWS